MAARRRRRPYAGSDRPQLGTHTRPAHDRRQRAHSARAGGRPWWRAAGAHRSGPAAGSNLLALPSLPELSRPSPALPCLLYTSPSPRDAHES
eukprot:6933565-Prymnesium_polylepis.1